MNLESAQKISASTRFAEGFFNGMKFSIVHALVYAPFISKERSIEMKTSYLREYILHCSKAVCFYTGILSCTFGMRHLVAENKDRILFDL